MRRQKISRTHTILLPHQDYNNFLQFQSIEDAGEYYKLLSKASDVLKNVTKRFYVHNDFETDVPERKEAYLKALACQIEYFYETGEMTTEGLNATPQMQQIGRTSISKVSSANSNAVNEKKQIVCEDIYLYLDDTGLLDRGID